MVPKPAPSIMVWVTVPSLLKTASYMRFRLPVLGAGQLEEQVQVLKAGHYMRCRVPMPGADKLEEQVQVTKQHIILGSKCQCRVRVNLKNRCRC